MANNQGSGSVARIAAGIVAGAVVWRWASATGAAKPVTYAPLDTPKPVGDELWIVDSGPVNAFGLELPVRMTVVRLSSGDILLHSPTRYSAGLAHAIETLGAVRHLVAPNVVHWTYLAGWQRAFPEAMLWAPPRLRTRGQVRRSGVRIDADLGETAPAAWAEDFTQGMVRGGLGFQEAYLFHKRSRTLLLADLIENLEADRMPPATGLLMAAASATRATTALHVRAVVALGGRAAASAIGAMVGLAPERVIFSHGRYFEADAAERLRAAFTWIGAG